jgi:glutamate synthase (NADPH/NADH) small chain
MHFAGVGRAALACPDLPAQILSDGALDPSKTCMLCFACSQLEDSSRAVGCVIRAPHVYGPIFRDMRRLEQDRLLAGAARCHLCEAAPCCATSPTKTAIPAFIKAFREGRERDAYEIVKATNPLPRLVSQTSPFWLEEEGSCIEVALRGEPVPIRDLQYTIAARAMERGETGIRLPDGRSGKTVAIVGGGPTGIAAAARLMELGHTIHLHETSDRLGGVASRLLAENRPIENPKAEIEALLYPALAAGRLKIFFGSTLGENLSTSELLTRHDSVLLALGLWQEQSIGSATGVLGALDFLERWSGAIPKRVVVLAGGDSAMDACSALKARGASQIYVVFRGPRSEMHWHMSESWFASPGVHAMMNWQPIRYETDASGNLNGVRLRHAEFDSEMLLPADLAIEAMGLNPSHHLLPADHPRIPWLYTAGAMVNGGASIGHCVAEGLAIAETIHRSLFR